MISYLVEGVQQFQTRIAELRASLLVVRHRGRHLRHDQGGNHLPRSAACTRPRANPTIFYTTEGEAKVEQPDHDIEAITAYLLHMTEAPEVALAKLNAEKAEKPATDWTKIEY